MKQKSTQSNTTDISKMSDDQLEKTLVNYLASKATSAEDFFGKDGLLAKMFGKSIETMLQAELSHHLGRDKYKRPDNNLENLDINSDYANSQGSSNNYRNGSSSKTLHTSVGSQEISVPRDRNGTFEPQVVGKYEKSTSEFEDKILSMYSHGTTVRDVQTQLMEMYGINVSPDFITHVTEKVNDMIVIWRNRPLEKTYAFVFFDAIYLKIKIDGKVETRAIYNCLAIDMEGKKDILGIWVSPAKESANFWLTVITDLQKRGVADILICSIDGLKGLRDAILSVYPKTIVQRCIVHLIRNTLKYVSWSDRKKFMADLRPVYTAVNEEAGLSALVNLKEKWGNKYMLAIRVWESNWEELNPFFEFSDTIRKIMYTTNSVESYHRVVRKYTKTKSLFPSETSALKTLYLATEGILKKWDKQVPNWNIILGQSCIKFEGRITE